MVTCKAFQNSVISKQHLNAKKTYSAIFKRNKIQCTVINLHCIYRLSKPATQLQLK